jgi:hypothetical protein
MEEKTEIEQRNMNEELLQDVVGGALPSGAAGDWLARQFASATARTSAIAERTGSVALNEKAAAQTQGLAKFFYTH